MRLISFLVFLSLCSICIGQHVDEWNLKKDENEVQVYTRQDPNSSFSELMMHTISKTTMTTIIALFKDIPNYTSWVYSCIVSESVDELVNNEEDDASAEEDEEDEDEDEDTDREGEDYYYSITTAPWPVSDRDLVVHSKVTQDTLTWVVTSTSEHVNGIVEKKDGMERVPLLQSAWTLIPLENGLVDITYRLKVDPGGYVPAWLANMTLTIGPYRTMLKLLLEIQKEKYRNATLDYIYEPFKDNSEN